VLNRKTPKAKPLYRQKPEEPHAKPQSRGDSPEFQEVTVSHFTLKDDGTIETGHGRAALPRRRQENNEDPAAQERSPTTVPQLIFTSDNPFLRLYHGNCLELLDAIAAKYPEGRFDAIFADPPYFLSNGGITCHAGKMVKVDKGDWDKSRGPALNHEFNKEWLARCQRVLKPNGTIWVSGTHHVIFSIGYAMQELGYKILNDIAWEKPNPPPNLSCRYFTHSTETILWAARDEKSKHVFNYKEMRKVTGKQMKTVWRELATETQRTQSSEERAIDTNVWTINAPTSAEKTNGKHPTQKPIALLERCIAASTNEGDLVLDPFLGGGTMAVACVRLKRGCVGVEADLAYISIAARRTDREIISIWLRHFRVRVNVVVCGRAALPRRREEKAEVSAAQQRSPTMIQKDLDLFSDSINGSRVDDKPQVPTERIFHECKFVFLSCAEVERGAVVHTTVDVSLQEAWAKTPNGKKRETTHIVRCETEIFRVKPN
jgi:site-specific DNA-methyltransferase (adenine-specific)